MVLVKSKKKLFDYFISQYFSMFFVTIRFRDIKALPGYNESSSNCSRHPENVETCQDCMRNVRLIINKLCEEGSDLTE